MMRYSCVLVQAKDLPEVIWKADPKVFYTLVMTGMSIKQINCNDHYMFYLQNKG